MDISLRGGSKGGSVLILLGLGCLLLAFELFGYVFAITEAIFSVIVLLFYLRLLVNAIKRKDKKFIVISLIILGIGAIVGFINPLEIDNVSLRFPFSSMFWSSLFLAIAGIFYVIDIPIYTGEKGMDLLMLVICFFAIFGIIYVFCFVLQLSSGDYEMYDSIDWLVYDSDKEEEYEAKAEFNNQTKTKELFIEFNLCDIENENIRRIS